MKPSEWIAEFAYKEKPNPYGPDPRVAGIIAYLDEREKDKPEPPAVPEVAEPESTWAPQSAKHWAESSEANCTVRFPFCDPLYAYREVKRWRDMQSNTYEDGCRLLERYEEQGRQLSEAREALAKVTAARDEAEARGVQSHYAWTPCAERMPEANQLVALALDGRVLGGQLSSGGMFYRPGLSPYPLDGEQFNSCRWFPLPGLT